MNKRAVLLAVAVVGTAMLVVQLRHESRLSFARLQALKMERDALDIEWGKLLLEEGAWSQHKRIAATAQTRLGMAMPRPEQAVVVDLRKHRKTGR